MLDGKKMEEVTPPMNILIVVSDSRLAWIFESENTEVLQRMLTGMTHVFPSSRIFNITFFEPGSAQRDPKQLLIFRNRLSMHNVRDWQFNFLAHGYMRTLPEGIKSKLPGFDCVILFKSFLWNDLWGATPDEDPDERKFGLFYNATKPSIKILSFENVRGFVLDYSHMLGTIGDVDREHGMPHIPDPNRVEDENVVRRRRFVARYFKLQPSASRGIPYFTKRLSSEEFNSRKRQRDEDRGMEEDEWSDAIWDREIAQVGLAKCSRLLTLSGPTYASFHRLGEKRILLLGESHSMMSLAPEHPDVQEIHTWLMEMAAFAPECLDIMVENTYQWSPEFVPRSSENEKWPISSWERDKVYTLEDMRKPSDDTSPLVAVTTLFRQCEYLSRLNCFSNSVRYHNIDMRRMFSLKATPIAMAPNVGEDLSHLSINGQLMEKGFYDIIRWLNRENHYYGNPKALGEELFRNVARGSCMFIATGDPSHEHWYAYAMELLVTAAMKMDPNITRGMLSMEKHIEFMKRTIMARLDHVRIKVHPAAVDRILQHLIKVSIDTFVRRCKHHTNRFCGIMWLITAFIVDFYMLLRMHENFDEEKLGPEGCRKPPWNAKTMNIIVYAGSDHVKHVSDVLQLMGSHLEFKFRAERLKMVPETPRRHYLTFNPPFNFWA